MTEVEGSDGHIARFLSEDVGGAIERQAGEAKRRGDATVTPVLQAHREVLRDGIGYVIKRAQWLQDPRIAKAVRLPTLAEEPANLRARTLAVVLLQLDGHGAA